MTETLQELSDRLRKEMATFIKVNCGWNSSLNDPEIIRMGESLVRRSEKLTRDLNILSNIDESVEKLGEAYKRADD